MYKKRHIDNHLEYLQVSSELVSRLFGSLIGNTSFTFLQGKRTWEETYEPPPKYNSFSEPWFDEKYSHMGGPMQT